MPTKEMIISANAHEKRVAIVENGVVTEFYVERHDDNRAVVGNIYKGKVMKVLPGMQSAFVDIGLERDAFLYVSDFFEDEDGEEFDTTPTPDSEPSARKPRETHRRPEREDPRRRDRDRGPAAQSPPPGPSAKPLDAPATVEALERVAEVAETDGFDDESSPDMPTVEETSELELDADELNAVLEAGIEEQYERIEPPVSEEPASADLSSSPAVGSLFSPATESHFERVTDHDVPREIPPAVKPASPAPVEVETPAPAETSKKKPGRGRKKAAEPEPVPEPPKKKPARGRKKAAEPEPTAESFERVLDDEILSEAGDLLKEAIVQQKIMRQTREAEYAVPAQAPKPIQPEPEVRVGSLRGRLDESNVFERVADDQAEPSAEGVSESSVEDAEASVGSRARNPEFASRRGRRGRRRGRPATGQNVQADEESETEAPMTVAESAELFAEAEAEGPAEPTNGREATEEVREPIRETPPPPPPPAPPAASPQKQGRPEREHRPREHRGRPPGIADLLREGQEILVQIAKEPIGLKGARITSYVALPGRYLVYMPTVNHLGVSRKIPSEQERIRLKRIMVALREREQVPGGFIVRTACEGHTEAELSDDMMYLYRTWQDIRKRSEQVRAGNIAYRELDLVQRLLRDSLSSDFGAIRVDSEDEYAKVIDFVSRFQPKLVDRVKLYTRKRQIFEEYGVQQEIDAAIRPRVWLRSGGFIVINQTEALVAIDVNTGKFVGRSNRLEDTIVKTNLEAAVEIVRQIRLRDLGGIIVLDFIDMEERRNRQKVMQVLEQEIRADRSPSKILQFNDFGLVAITRKRVRQSLERTLCEPCSYCNGAGMIKSVETMCYEVLAEAKRMAHDFRGERNRTVMLRVNPSVAKALRTTEAAVFEEIETCFSCPVEIQPDATIHQEHFDFAVL